MFLINSCSHLITSTPLSLRSKCFTKGSVPSPEVTVPFCLVPSPKFSQAPWYSLPDHLCRFTVRSSVTYSLEGFPGSMASTTSPLPKDWVVITSQGNELPDLPRNSPYSLKPGQPTPGWPSLLRHSIAVTAGTGILTGFPSTTAFALALGAD